MLSKRQAFQTGDENGTVSRLTGGNSVAFGDTSVRTQSSVDINPDVDSGHVRG